MSEEEKEAKESIEYLKARLYGNEDCEYIDVAQKDLRIFINLVETQEKDIESWKKYSNEQEENIIRKNNQISNLEFLIEKTQKENEKYKRLAKINLKNAEEFKNNMCEHRCLLKSENEELQKENEELKADNYELNNRITDLLENILVQKVKDKIEDLEKDESSKYYYMFLEERDLKYTIQILQELLEEIEEKIK